MAPFARILIALLWLALPATAGEYCRAEVNATEVVVDRTSLGAPPAAPGLKERAVSWPARGIDRLLGRAPRCDSETLIAFLSDEVEGEQIDGYCLSPDEAAGYLLVPGPRDYRGRCARTTCDRVNAVRDGAVGVAGAATDIVTGRDAGSGQTRPTAILHASGAAILSGSAANLAASLGATATSVTTALAAPAIAGAAAVSVVAVGGAVYLCR